MAVGWRTQTRTPKGGRKRKKKRDWRPVFLREFAKTGLVIDAAKRAKVARSTVYEERQRNEDFALKWAEIEEWTTEEMEQEARRRAVKGVEEPVFYKGELQGHTRKYSDTLLIFMLKSRKPETYREIHLHKHDGKITHEHEVSAKAESEIDRLLAELGSERQASAAGASS